MLMSALGQSTSWVYVDPSLCSSILRAQPNPKEGDCKYADCWSLYLRTFVEPWTFSDVRSLERVCFELNCIMESGIRRDFALSFPQSYQNCEEQDARTLQRVACTVAVSTFCSTKYRSVFTMNVQGSQVLSDSAIWVWNSPWHAELPGWLDKCLEIHVAKVLLEASLSIWRL